MSATYNTAIKAAASLVDQIDGLKALRDQAAVLQQAGSPILTIGLAAPIQGDTGNIAVQLAQALQQNMTSELSVGFVAIIDQSITSLQLQLDQQIALITGNNTPPIS